MEWHDSYNIGIEHIDMQHQELFSLVKNLQKSVAEKTIMNKLGATITFLVEYTQQHFKDEENFMLGIEYPSFAEHKKLHKNLIQEITDVLIKIKKGKTIDPFEIVDFLIDWLLNHIRYEDKKIGKFMSQRDDEKGK